MLDGNIPLPNVGAYGLHNIPGGPLGQIMLRDEGVAARASCGARFHLRGKSSHASQPELGVSPAVVLASLLTAEGELTALPQRLLDAGTIGPQIQNGKVLATPVHVALGEDGDFGILPGVARINVTLRADTTQDLTVLREAVEQLVHRQASIGGCELVGVDIVEPFPATVNDPRRAKVVRAVASEMGLDVTTMDSPFPWSEDFAYFGERCKSGAVLFGLGSGQQCPPLHSKDYDFPDELLGTGVELWTRIAKVALTEPPQE
jgi:metal-dependent amidase/aminoacylase/carboxypeptidase family protein